jgi:hypothetical protein
MGLHLGPVLKCWAHSTLLKLPYYRRREAQAEFRKRFLKRPRPSIGSRVWLLLNSGLFLWFLSAVLLASAGAYFQTIKTVCENQTNLFRSMKG